MRSLKAFHLFNNMKILFHSSILKCFKNNLNSDILQAIGETSQPVTLAIFCFKATSSTDRGRAGGMGKHAWPFVQIKIN